MFSPPLVQHEISSRRTSIHLRQISKTFPDGTKAVDGINLDIQEGELLAMVGPSGCGKTTTLRIIGGLEEPDPGGEVLYGTQNMARVPIEKRNVGIVFQNYALFPNMTVFQNVEYGLRMRKVPKADRRKRVSEVLEMVQIPDLADRYPHTLSGGQKQRVALARALAFQPEILLLDEPLTALDAKLREQLRVELDRLLKSLQITTVYVTHDQAEAMSLGDRVAVMHRGKIVQIGTPFEIYHHPVDPFVATFIGTTNMAQGRVIEREGKRFVDLGYAQLSIDHLLSGKDQGEVTVMFRPEDIMITTPENALFSGVVKSAFYLGEKTRVFFETTTGVELIADITEHRTIHGGDHLHFTLKENALYTFKPVS